MRESDVRRSTVEDLRREAKDAGLTGTSGMRKDELVEAVVEIRRRGGDAGSGGAGAGDASRGPGPDGGHVRTGQGTSKSLKYSQEVTSTQDEPEREGRSLVTTNHDVIREWAEERSGVPATVDGTEHGDHLGVLRFDFGGDNERLRQVSWDEWFRTFDDRRLNFIYQDSRSDGSQSSFFRLESPDREDA
ncbi:MAG: Rho termination factor N-terminal domain-containing protein [Ornithinibacter sp.]